MTTETKNQQSSFEHGAAIPDFKTADLEALAKRFGFNESEKLKEISKKFQIETEDKTKLMEEWLIEAQSMVDALTEDEIIKARIGLMYANTALYLKLGKQDLARETYREAEEFSSYVSS